MPERRLSAVVLAAGEGTRMRSERPKPLHLLCGRPMILHVLDAMAEIDVRRVVVVVGHRGEWVTKTLVQHAPPTMEIEFVEQLTRTGTGDALAVGLTGLARRRDDEVEDVVVLPGDTPLLRPQTLAALVRAHRAEDAGATLLTAVVENPAGLRPGRPRQGRRRDPGGRGGRRHRGGEGHRRGQHLHLLLPPQHPGAHPAPAQPGQRPGRVLPDRRRRPCCSSAGYTVRSLVLPDSMEAAGVNDRAQLAVAEAELRDRINERWMRRGVTMWDPERTYVDAEVHLEADVSLLPGVILRGNCVVGAGAEIGPNSVLTDTTVGRGRGGGRERLHPGHHRRRGARSAPTACSSPGPRWRPARSWARTRWSGAPRAEPLGRVDRPDALNGPNGPATRHTAGH